MAKAEELAQKYGADAATIAALANRKKSGSRGMREHQKAALVAAYKKDGQAGVKSINPKLATEEMLSKIETWTKEGVSTGKKPAKKRGPGRPPKKGPGRPRKDSAPPAADGVQDTYDTLIQTLSNDPNVQNLAFNKLLDSKEYQGYSMTRMLIELWEEAEESGRDVPLQVD